MSAMASQITSLTIVYSTVYSDTYQRKHQCSALLAFVRGIHRWPVNSSHKGPVTRKMFPLDDVIMWWLFHRRLYDHASTPTSKNRPEKHICCNCVNPHRFVHIFPHDTTNNHDYSLYHCLISTTRSREMIWVYWTGVKIITCTLSKVTRYSQSVPGLFAGTLGVSQLNLLWQTNRPIKSSLLAPARPWRFPLKHERTKRMIITVNVQQLF